MDYKVPVLASYDLDEELLTDMLRRTVGINGAVS